MTTDQLREAESVFRRLIERPRSLSLYIDYALANHREPEQIASVPEAVAAYIAVRAEDNQRGLLSHSMKMQIGWELDAFKKHVAKATVAEITPQQLLPFLERPAASLKTCNNRRAIVYTFLRFAFMQDWIVTNPLEKIPHYRIAHRRGSTVTLSAHQCVDLMAEVETVADGRLVPFFALRLFAGIRPSVRDGEISKLRPEHIRLDTSSIMVAPEVSNWGASPVSGSYGHNQQAGHPSLSHPARDPPQYARRPPSQIGRGESKSVLGMTVGLWSPQAGRQPQAGH